MFADDLRDSILQEAIQGKLVPQDPNDEPAEKLVKRIRAEKQRLIKEKKIKKEKNVSEIYRRDGSWYETIDGKDERCIDDEIPFEIPESWIWCRIGMIFTLQAGKNIDTKEISGSESTVCCYPCIGGNGLRGFVSKFNVEGRYAIIGRQGALCGNIKLIDGQYYATEHAVIVYHHNCSNPDWSSIFLEALDLNQYATSTAQPGLAVGNIVKVLIPVPPICEQKRIVDKYNSIIPIIKRYCQIESDYHSLIERIPNDLKQSILQSAVQGKLVPQDPNDESAEELVKRIRAEKQRLIKEKKIKKEKNVSEIYRRDGSWYETIDGKDERCIDDEVPFDIPESWTLCRMSTICTKITDGTHHSPPNGPVGDYKYVSAKNIKENGIDLKDITYVSKEIHEAIFSRCNPEYGDILLIKDGATAGVVTINNLHEQFSLLSSVGLLKTLDCINNQYLVCVIRSSYFQESILRKMKGTGIPRITLDIINNFLVPIPPRVEQERIVSKINSLLSLLILKQQKVV